MDRPGHLLLVLPQGLGPVERMQRVPSRLALHLPGAHRTHHKRRIHRDFHDVTNNILALYYDLL